jgi:hypothetical protein
MIRYGLNFEEGNLTLVDLALQIKKKQYPQLNWQKLVYIE